MHTSWSAWWNHTACPLESSPGEDGTIDVAVKERFNDANHELSKSRTKRENKTYCHISFFKRRGRGRGSIRNLQLCFVGVRGGGGCLKMVQIVETNAVASLFCQQISDSVSGAQNICISNRLRSLK